MKRIIDYCNDTNNFPQSHMVSEGVKMRLRGKGSGFLEGYDKKESQDPLNLCISSKDKNKYKYACD